MDRSIGLDERKPDGRITTENHPVGKDRSSRSSPDRLAEDIAALRKTLEHTTQDKPTMSELLNRLEDASVQAVPSFQKSGRLNGMSYDFNGTRYRGSDLGRAYTATGLQKQGVRYDPQTDDVLLQEIA